MSDWLYIVSINILIQLVQRKDIQSVKICTIYSNGSVLEEEEYRGKTG